MTHEHAYEATTVWSGARAGATRSYDAYSREYTAVCHGKPELLGSADPAFRGDSSLYNPEELLLIALSACHLLSYLAECARAGIAVVEYRDQASGTMAIKEGKRRFVEVILRPNVRIAGGDIEVARRLHEKAHDLCFIANSVAFPVRHEAVVRLEEEGGG